jgi:hypothetical protein
MAKRRTKLTSTTKDMTDAKKLSHQPHHESALMAAVHILVCLTQEGKTIEEIARKHFDNNLELVAVWVDYMIGICWMYENKNAINDGNKSNNKWIATDNGKIWIEKYYYAISCS